MVAFIETLKDDTCTPKPAKLNAWVYIYICVCVFISLYVNAMFQKNWINISFGKWQCIIDDKHEDLPVLYIVISRVATLNNQRVIV